MGEHDTIEEILGRAERAADPETQARLLLEAAALYDAAAEPERAALVRATAERLRPGTSGDAAIDELGRRRALDAALAAEVDAATSDDERCRTLLRLAELREQSLGDGLGAEEACRRALAIDPLLAPARAHLERLVRARGDHGALLALLDDRAALLPDDVAALHEAAALCEALDRLPEAAQRWAELHARVPGDPAPLRALDRLYALLGRLRARTAVLEALLGLIDSERERAALHRELAAAWGELGERGRAIESLEWLLMSEPDAATWAALTALYRAEGRFAALADACTRQLRGAEPARRAALLGELAGLYERELGDPGQAISCWQTLLAEAPDAGQALEALARLYEAIDAADRAADCLERWAALTDDGRTRAERLARAAELCASHAELAERTAELLARALAAAPDWVPVRAALVAHHRRRGERERAAALLAGAGAGAGHPALLAEAAALREAEGDLDGAFAALRALVEAAPDHVDARRRACALGLALGRHTDVLELAAALPDDGPTALRIERWLALARAGQAVGDRALAGDALDHAARLAPARADVRRLQAERLLADGEVAEAERLVAALKRDPETPPGDGATLAFLAGECARARQDLPLARRHYREALALDRAHRPALRQLLDLAVELGLWHEALEVLDGLVALERDPSLRARYRHLAGHIYEEELARPAEALARYRAALADDPDHPRACERIAALLRAQGDFAGLAAHCAQALGRLGDGGDPARRAPLWSALADAATGLGDRDGTSAALEVVVRLDANNWSARRRLAELYLEAGPDALEQAIAAQHALLRLDKLHVPAYRALGKLYQQVGAPARAAACDQAARLLSARDAARAPDEPAPALVPVTRALAPADWARVQAPEEDRFLALLSALVAPLLAGAAAIPLDPARGRPGTPLADGATPPFLQALRWAAGALDVPLPDVFTRDDQLAPVRFVNGRDAHGLRPALVVGLPLLGDRRRAAELVAPLALELALLRPERRLRLLVPDASVLALLLRATVSVACDEPPAPELAVTAAGLRRWLAPPALEQIGVVGRRLRDGGRDLGRVAAEWMRAADLTAARAALVVTGDLPRTLAAIEACALDPATVRHAVGELVWASITDEVWTTREALLASPAAPSRTAHARG